MGNYLICLLIKPARTEENFLTSLSGLSQKKAWVTSSIKVLIFLRFLSFGSTKIFGLSSSGE